MLKFKIILIVVLLYSRLHLADYCFAHQETNHEWEPLSAGPLTTWTAPLCGKNKFVLQPFFFYSRIRGVFNAEGRYDSLPAGNKKYQFQQQLFAQYGLTERLEIDGQVVYQENFAQEGLIRARSAGFGDSYLFWRYCLLEEEINQFHLSSLFAAKFPTGKYQKAAPGKLGTDLMAAVSGGGSYDYGLGLILSKKVRPWVIHADFIYNFPARAKVEGIKTEYGRYSNYDFGAEYFLKGGFNLMLEFNGFFQGGREENGEKIVSSDVSFLIAACGLGWSNDKFQTLLVYQRALTGTNSDANDSIILTLVYSF